MKIKILVAAHKKYRMPEDSMYMPIHVGKAGKDSIGYPGDDTGENISVSNPRFCELTGIYWAWKNLQADYIGSTHYRRHFTAAGRSGRLRCKDKFGLVLKRGEAEKLLSTCDLIVPNKRKYYIESIRSHFIHLPYTYEKDLRILEETIQEIAPEYADAFWTVMNRSWAHMFNMFLMKKSLFDAYCEWMFPILFAVDRKIDVSGYTAMEARAVAYFGEFMLDIWCEKNKVPYREVNVMFMEKQSMLVKAWTAFKRKFGMNFKEKARIAVR